MTTITFTLCKENMEQLMAALDHSTWASAPYIKKQLQFEIDKLVKAKKW